MAANKPAASSAARQTIEQLQKRYQDLHTKRIQAQTNLEHADSTLKLLQEEAREKFGTDDIVALRAKLEEMKTDNEKKRAEYQASLDAIESALEAVETNLTVAEAPAQAAGSANPAQNS